MFSCSTPPPPGHIPRRAQARRAAHKSPSEEGSPDDHTTASFAPDICTSPLIPPGTGLSLSHWPSRPQRRDSHIVA